MVPEKVKNNIPYKYMEQKPPERKNYRDAEGAVITEPNNFVTNNLKSGRVGKGTSFGGMIPHMPEDPDALRKIRLSEMAYHKSMVPEDAKPFSSQARKLHWGTFNPPISVLGGASLALTRNVKSQKMLTDIHDGAKFKPCGPGKKKATLAPFPLFMPDPPK
jgi:hypothetical protein